MKKQSSRRILIFLGDLRGSESLQTTLSHRGYDSFICSNGDELCREVSEGAGALLVGKEVVSEGFLSALGKCLNDQPAWSHLPIVALLSEGNIASGTGGVLNKLEAFGNVTLLESPVRDGTLVTTIRSILAYRAKQYDVRDLLKELEASRTEAIEANRAKSDFLANMSHEIRTPLGAILGFSELLMDAGVSEREKQVYMVAVKRNGQILSALIDDILDLAKVEAGRIEVVKIEFSLGELLSGIVSNLGPAASKKGLPLVWQRPANAWDMIVSDPIRLKQILTNVVGNAIKFTSHGEVAVRVDVARVDGGGAQLQIEVEDTGIGISKQQEAGLFQPFTQADTSATRRFGGTGLGLVLSRKLASAMGGDLQLKWSVPGGGSNFRLVLPVQVAHQTQPSEREGAGCEQKSPAALPLSGADILLVDDSLDNQMLISRILNLLGAKVQLANDGVEAVEKALAHEYDVVLMDLQMPRLGGVEATRILREKGYQRPIVALTAHALNVDRQRCISVGCTDYLTKPIQRAHLVQVIERVARSGRPPVSQHH